jgi:hypothetical protein
MPENENPSQEEKKTDQKPDSEQKPAEQKPDENAADAKKTDHKKPGGKLEQLKPKHADPEKLAEQRKAIQARKTKGKGRRLSDTQRKALWKKAVLKKARKLKHITDVVIISLLVVVLVVHVFTFVRVPVGRDRLWEKRGYELVIDLLKTTEIDWYEDYYASWRVKDSPKVKVTTWGVYPRLGYLTVPGTGEVATITKPDGTPGPAKRFEPICPATWLVRAYLLVPILAALLLLLYLVDYLVFMGRLLPLLSFMFGFGSVGYLMTEKLRTLGSWNVFHGFMPNWVWLTLMIPLFCIGAVSMLRSVVSHRYKRYEFRGLPVPEHLKPKKRGDDGEGGADAAAKDGTQEAGEQK